MNRRDVIKTAAVTAGLSILGPSAFPKPEKTSGKFKFCLNTSTISGQKPGVKKYIDIAARAGYDCLEIWIGDVKEYINSGGSLPALKKLLQDSKVEAADAIGFASWMVNDDEKRRAGFQQMKEEMEILAALDCRRVAAPSAGIREASELPDMFKVGERYEELIALGRQTGVVPQLEFWGASQFFHIGQALMAAAVTNDPGARILADVYHLYRGGSGFECLKMIDGSLIEIIHMNDYPGTIPREKLEDKDRVYPGDGVAPLRQILTDLKKMKGEKILSLEVFNREYWAQDPLQVAKTGLEKMKKAVAEAG
ncbi:MAG TPA: sugar phosphate isomerase/epimerase [Cyclobacteriaceae bacterium]|nr:sugar phosphate isomerase/epimerase [Cyclobacteriaceae bacterium]